MRTPWGEIPIEDSHVHFFSHKFFSMLAAQRNSTAGQILAELEWEAPAPEPEALADRWVAELDRHGVQRAAVIGSLPGEEDSVAAAVGRHPDRFYGLFMVNPLTPGAAAAVSHALDGGLRCPCLFPAMHRYSTTDDRLVAIAEAVAARPGKAIFVHCGILTVGIRKKLGLPSPFDMRFSNPIDLHGLALRFPNVPFIVPHFGAGFFREALMLCDLCPNVYLDTSSSNSWMRYLEPDCGLARIFRQALEVAGPNRLLFGTDSSFFPRGWQARVFDAQVHALKDAGVTEADARGVLGANLRRLFS